MHRHLPSGFLVPPTGSVTSCHHQVDVSTKRKKKKSDGQRKKGKAVVFLLKRLLVGINKYTHDIFRLIVFFLFPRRKDQWPSQTIEFESEWRSNESNLDSLYKEKCSNVRVAKQKKEKILVPFTSWLRRQSTANLRPFYDEFLHFSFSCLPFFKKRKKLPCWRTEIILIIAIFWCILGNHGAHLPSRPSGRRLLGKFWYHSPTYWISKWAPSALN